MKIKAIEHLQKASSSRLSALHCCNVRNEPQEVFQWHCSHAALSAYC